MVAVRPVSIGGANRARSAAAPTGVAPSGALQTQIAPPDTSGPFRAVAQAANNLGEEIQRNQIRRDRLQAATMQAQYETEVQTQIAELDPTAPDYEQQVQAVTAATRNDFIQRAEFQTQEIAEAFSAQLEITNAGLLGRAVGERRQVMAQEALELAEGHINTFENQVRADPEAVDLYRQATQRRLDELEGVIPHEQHDNIQRGMDAAAIRGEALGLADEGRYQAARSLLDGEDAQRLISGSGQQTIRNQIRTIRNQRRSDARRAAALTADQLDLQIAQASTIGELDAVEQDFQALQERGAFASNPGAAATLQRRLDNQRSAFVEESRAQTEALERYSSGLGHDTQEQADRAWQELYGQDAPESTAQLADRVGRFTEQSGRLPTPIEQMIDRAERSSNADQLALAAQVVDNVDARTNGAVDTGAGDRIEQVRTRARTLGIDYTAAAQQVLDLSPGDRQEIERRREVFDQEILPDTSPDVMVDELNDVFGSGGHLFGTFGGLTADDIPAEAFTFFEQAFRQAYELSGDQDLARRTAAEQTRRRYGVSDLAGPASGPGVMANPPERHMGNAQTRQRFTRDQLSQIARTEVQGILGEAGIFGEDFASVDADIPPWQLVPDDQTERDLRNGRQPTYGIYIRNRFGALVPARPVDENGVPGSPLRFAVPNQTELQDNPLYRDLVEQQDAEDRRDRIQQGNLLPGDPRGEDFEQARDALENF